LRPRVIFTDIDTEITGILEETGGNPYFDKEAAAKYIVYGGNNWISFDDAETFKLKIDYANKMGLGGLMVWAIDQDDIRLTALRAVTDSDLANDDSPPFNLVDLHKIFPKEGYPTNDKNPKYGMVNFGSEADLGESNPQKTGFGWFLVVGESHAVSRLKRKSGDPEPFTFLDCPVNITGKPDDQVQIARVVCLSADVEGCFRVMERGVEGTVVEMPDNVRSLTFNLMI
jgi:chitinase